MGEKPSKKDLCQRQGLAELSQREGEGNSRYIKIHFRCIIAPTFRSYPRSFELDVLAQEHNIKLGMIKLLIYLSSLFQACQFDSLYSLIISQV